MMCIAITDDQQVAVEMDRRFRQAGGAGCEAEQARIIPACRDRLEIAGGTGQQCPKLSACIALPGHQSFNEIGLCHGILHLADQRVIAKGNADFGLVDDLDQFTGAQEWHGRDHNAARFDDRHIERNLGRVIARADHHAIACFHAELVGQHIGDLVDHCGEIAIGPAHARRLQCNAVAFAVCKMCIHQFGGGIELFRVAECVEVDDIR